MDKLKKMVPQTRLEIYERLYLAQKHLSRAVELLEKINPAPSEPGYDEKLSLDIIDLNYARRDIENMRKKIK